MSVFSNHRPPRTLRFGRLGGADLLARPSLLLTGAILVMLFAPHFATDDRADAYLMSTGFVLALYVSMLVHELAHLGVARAYGMHVPSVTLHLLGGETAIQGESRTPAQELATSAAGPVASLLIGLSAHAVADHATGLASGLWWSIGWVNLLVAAFNMLPGLPLDGGRVLRAVVWMLTGSERLGIVVTAWTGRATAVGVSLYVLSRTAQGDTWSAYWWVDVVLVAFVASFLWMGATAALRGVDQSARMRRLRADLLARPLPDDVSVHWPRLPMHTHGAVLLRAMNARQCDTYLLVDDDGTAVGVLLASDVDAAYRKES